MKKYVLMFGAFNPVSLAHIAIGKKAYEAVTADEVLFIPANKDFVNKKMKKKNNDLAWPMGTCERAELLQTAPIDYPASMVDLELYPRLSSNKGIVDGKTYNTVQYMKNNLAEEAELYICLGADKVEELDSWYKAENLIAENKFLIMTRNGVKLDDVKNKSELVSKYYDNFISLDVDDVDNISSSAIRQAYANNDFVQLRKLAPQNVIEYLEECKYSVYRVDTTLHKDNIKYNLSDIEIPSDILNSAAARDGLLETIALRAAKCIDFDKEIIEMFDELISISQYDEQNLEAIKLVKWLYEVALRKKYKLTENNILDTPPNE